MECFECHRALPAKLMRCKKCRVYFCDADCMAASWKPGSPHSPENCERRAECIANFAVAIENTQRLLMADQHVGANDGDKEKQEDDDEEEEKPHFATRHLLGRTC